MILSKFVSKDKKDKESEWTTTPIPNLVRFEPSGRYYIRARVGKKEAVRKSLKTTDFWIAKVRCAQELAKMRANAPLRRDAMPETLWDALKVVRAQIEANPALKRRSVRAYLDVFKSLAPGKPGAVPMLPLVTLAPRDMEDWWKATAAAYSPASANFHLLLVRRAIAAARDSGAIQANPAATLKRLRIPPTKLKLITPEQFKDLVAAIRADDDEEASAAADWIELACYTGGRPEEINSMRWEHVDRKNKRLTIVGAEEGTKNRETRPVPITAQLGKLLDRLPRRPDGLLIVPGDYGKILARVSEAIGLPRLRRYDMRHLFATRCSQAGVDIPTVARWLGHRDGGALAMKVYFHPHELHDARSAARVKF